MADQVSPSVLIIGAGIGGITTALALKDRLRFTNFEIIEKGEDVGGTWRYNRYPGCTSDVGIHYYSLSTHLNPNWNTFYGKQPEILAYVEKVVEKTKLRPYMTFNTKVEELRWDNDAQHWLVHVKNVKTGETRTKIARVVVSAAGILHEPQWPNIPGLNSFQGKLMHTAQWDVNADLKGKRVAVIGTGSSACQTIPVISKIEGIQVTQFIRQRQWLLPSGQGPFSGLWKAAFRYIPFAMILFRLSVFLRCELNYVLVFRFNLLRKFIATKLSLDFIKSKAPKEYREKLIPAYPLGGRRIIYDYGYLDALNQTNVQLRTDDLEDIYEGGIITKDGEKHPFDVIVCATGFVTNRLFTPVHGVNESMQEFEERHEGPAAYQGMLVPGFPNLLLINGPNTATGHTSVIFFTEVAADYFTKLLKPIIAGKYSTFEVTTAANDAYNANIQERLNNPRTPFHSAPKGWYRVGQTGRNAAIYPGSAFKYWFNNLNVKWSDLSLRRKDGARVDKASLAKGQGGVVAMLSMVLGVFAAGVWYTGAVA